MSRLDPGSRSLIAIALVGVLVAFLAGCTPSHPQSTFDTVGQVARSQLTLLYIIFWAGLFVFIAVEGAIVYTAIRYRRRPGDEGDPEQVHGNTRLEVAWTIAPAIVLAVVAVPTLFTIFDNANSPEPPEQGGLVVDAVAHQWWFEFRYPHPQNEGQEVVFANELHIPVGEVVNVRLGSVDVIHSFWIPKLAGKVDMIPNNDNTMWLEADEPGDYYGQCAEFCGVSHANMRFRVIAEPREEFDAWLLAQADPAMEPAYELEVQGKDLFMTSASDGGGDCRACHTIRGTKARGSRAKSGGPDLTHFASRQRFAGSILKSTQPNLREWLEDPCKVKPGNIMCREAVVFNMPESALTEPQISALIAYLQSLK